MSDLYTVKTLILLFDVIDDNENKYIETKKFLVNFNIMPLFNM